MSLNISRILAIETASPVCSVALRSGDDGEIISRRAEGFGKHAETLLPFIKELLAESGLTIREIEAVAISSGPGSFTGLRIAGSTVRGLLYQMPTPVFSCNTLAGVAFRAAEILSPEGSIHAVLDARRQHLYYQRYEIKNGLPVAPEEVHITSLEQFVEFVTSGDVIAGTGIERLSEQVRDMATTIGTEAIDACGLLRLVFRWQEQSRPESCDVHITDVQAFQPRYYSDGPPVPRG